MLTNSHFLKHLAPTPSECGAPSSKPLLNGKNHEHAAAPAGTLTPSFIPTQHESSFRYHPVNNQVVEHLKTRNATWLELISGDQIYDQVCKYIAEKAPKAVNSWKIEINQRNGGIDPYLDEKEEFEKARKQMLRLRLGLGMHQVQHGGHSIHVVHQVIGEPLATHCGPTLFTSLVLFVESPNKEQVLKAFCQEVMEWSNRAEESKYNIYAWLPDNMYWHMLATKTIRPVESVILPQKVKELVVKDLVDFCSRDTARWYVDHGVPYKRSMIFYGPPGTGKSSLITALAGMLKRDVCFLQPSHPSITDDNLQRAIQRAPARSIIVMEDVDALFDNNRKSEVKSSPLTFSGLLNALDGVCNPEGQIFILSTNHIDRLDPALIRAGRVDVKVPFPSATAKQAESLFLHFYPKETECAKQFASVIFERFPSKNQGKELEAETKSSKQLIDDALLEGWTDSHQLAVSMASLQSHFIACRKMSAREALEKASDKEFFDPDIAEEKQREETEERSHE